MCKEDCIFCKIGKGELPSNTVFENSEFRAFLDIAPGAKGHTLIIPKDHARNIYEIDCETAGKLFSLATEIARAIKQELGCEGMNVVQNNGAVAGQTVDHFHLHLIPRNADDDVNVKWNPKETDAKEQEALASALRKRI